jgi:cyclase
MRPRVIPVLLLDSRKRLVKTRNFDDPTYVGDPFNVIRLFNEKEVDEIIVLDIEASMQGRKPDRGFLRELASECFMPLGYGGGIALPEDAQDLFSVGIEKVVIGRQSTDIKLIATLTKNFGAQAVAACMDCRRSGGVIRFSLIELRERLLMMWSRTPRRWRLRGWVRSFCKMPNWTVRERDLIPI